MESTDESRNDFIKIIWDTLTSFVYLGGVIVIEVYLRPLTAGKGATVPLFVDWFLWIGDITLIFGLLRKLVRITDLFLKELFGTWTLTSISEKINHIKDSRKAASSQNTNSPSNKKEGGNA